LIRHTVVQSEVYEILTNLEVCNEDGDSKEMLNYEIRNFDFLINN